MEVTKFEKYIEVIRNSKDYKLTLATINRYLLEMQSLLIHADFNKRMSEFNLLILIPENDDAVNIFEGYSGLKLLNKEDIIERLTAFNEYKYERIYGKFFNDVITNKGLYNQCENILGLLPFLEDNTLEENIYNLQFSLRRKLNEILTNLDYNNAKADEELLNVIGRLMGDKSLECMKEILQKKDLDVEDLKFLSFNDINNIRIYFDLEEFVD
jgi:hypothetical protein|nr:MAG TPA: hypothetical protein [Caudoviricetes sp.]